MTRFPLLLALWLAVPPLAAASPNRDLVFWILSLYEQNLALKNICATRFPQYAETNEAAYHSSSFSAHSGETIVAAWTEGTLKEKLLDRLPVIQKNMRAMNDAVFQKLNSAGLEDLCRQLPESLKQVGTLLDQPPPHKDRGDLIADPAAKP